MKDVKKPFHWGIATSALQTEGASYLEGKGPSIWDEFSLRKGKIAGGHTPEIANSFYYRYEEDLDIVQSLHIPNFRFSISWPRVLPQGTRNINQKGIDYYDRLIDACLERGITPWVTLYHWDLPLQLELIGGWNNRDILSWFSEYVELMLEKFGDRVSNWMVLNEPLVFTGAGYFLGIHAPGKKGMSSFLSAAHHASLAQAAGIRQIKEHSTSFNVGTTYSCSWITTLSDSKNNQQAAVRVDALMNRFFVEPLLGYGYPIKDLPFLREIEKFYQKDDETLLKASPDFIGIQNYTREVVKHSWFTPYINAKLIDARTRQVPHTLLNWEIYPEGIHALIHKYAAYPEVKNIIVSENGAAFPDQVTGNEIKDSQRLNYLKNYMLHINRARMDCSKLSGYFVWSLHDNFEWAEGYYPRFGLVHIDYTNQKRTIKESGYWYKNHILNQKYEDKIQHEHQLSSSKEER